MNLDVREVAQEADYYDTNWSSKTFNFSDEGEDISGYNALVIKASAGRGRLNAKIQLLDSLKPEIVNTKRGLHAEIYSLSQEPEVTKIQIPLSEFRDLEIDLANIKRLAIHYGQRVWNEELNDTNTNQIIIEKVEFAGNSDC